MLRRRFIENCEMNDSFHKTHVIPAKAGIQRRLRKRHWVPAFAGTTTAAGGAGKS